MLPSDPNILLSYINTKLRDEFSSLEKLADGLDVDLYEIKEKLASIGYEYKEEVNQFKTK
ncbi:MAG: DUF4250 domain-containing protein [Lachnospiraceae bacterium]|nr:DUF4250 domain-containing protein [Lachnospiraceae bacterium]